MLTIDRVLGAGDDSQIEYIRRNPSSLVYANPRFLKLIEKHLNANPGWLVAKRDSNVVGMLPFMKKEGPLGPVLNSLAYYGSNGGVIQDSQDVEAKANLIQAFYKEAESVNACSATIVINPLEHDADFYNEYTQYHFRDERIGQVTHFPELDDVDDLITYFQNPRPRNIRRAIKEGIIVEKTNAWESVKFLYEIHANNMELIGGLAKSRSFFLLMNENMKKKDWSIFIAYLDGKPIAALLVFYFNKTVEYFTPIILEEYRNTQALTLVIYKAMQDAILRGFLNWNWGGTWLTQGGVYDFKKRWGTSEYQYYYYTKVFNNEILNKSTEYLLNSYKGFFVIPFSEIDKI